jgi:hypothetical protein
MRFTTFFALLFATIFASAAISAPAEAKNNNYDKQANVLAMQMYAQQLANNGQLPTPAPSPWVYSPAPNPYARAYSNDPYNQPYYYHNGYNQYPDYNQAYPVYQRYPQQWSNSSSSKWSTLLNLLAPQN